MTHLRHKCADCDSLTTKTWCKPCGYKNRNLSAWNKGLSWSQEVKDKISATKTGVKNPAHSEWLRGNPNKYWLGKKRPEMQGSANKQWRGDSVGYRALHIWVENQLGRPDTCEHCGKNGLTQHKIQWANKTGQYSRNVSDWLRLCTSCHREYDKKEVCH